MKNQQSLLSREIKPEVKSRPSAALWALTISSFAIGTTEFVMVGILPTIAQSLNVSVSMAGMQVTAYALGVAIGGPVLTALTSNIARKPLLIGLMAMFVISHLAAAYSPTFEFLLATRFISGFAHGVFIGVGATVAVSLVTPDKKAMAIAIMFIGFTIATIAGVPLGTVIGQHLGWRFTLIGVAILGAIGLLSNLILLPNNIEQGLVLTFKEQFNVLFNKHIILILSVTALGYGGTFVAFTYLAALLQQVTGFSPGYISLLLLLYGLAMAVGNIIGGKVSNNNPVKVLLFIFAFQAVVLVIFAFTEYYKLPAVITLFFMGGLGYSSVPALQLYIVQISGKYLPGTENVSSSLNIAAFNVGVAIGATVGGLVIGSKLGIQATPWISSLLVLLGVILTCVSYKLEK
jgi:predicted MFS family arabinose efflux permease